MKNWTKSDIDQVKMQVEPLKEKFYVVTEMSLNNEIIITIDGGGHYFKNYDECANWIEGFKLGLQMLSQAGTHTHRNESDNHGDIDDFLEAMEMHDAQVLQDRDGDWAGSR